MSNGSAMSSLASLPVDGQLPSNWYCWQGGWQIFQHPVGLPTALEAGEESHRHDLSRVFMTVGDLLWQPSELCRVHGSADTSLCGAKLTKDAGIDRHIVRLLRQRDTCTLVLAVEAREGPNTSSEAERLMATTGHLIEDVTASYHPPGLAGDVAKTSSNTQWAFRQCSSSVMLTHRGIPSSSVPSLSSPSV